ncbi:MAG: hypothetical protein K9W44_10865 [Candidatus Lokiarchaeota archaeon]|nr:hypothetical protein [Candidatus Harpocratesius repetitus]
MGLCRFVPNLVRNNGQYHKLNHKNKSKSRPRPRPRRKRTESSYLRLDSFLIKSKSKIKRFAPLDKYLGIETPIKNDEILVILSCTKKKLNHPAPASELYQGDVFKKAHIWVTQHKFNELIVSAKYGLVEPDEILEPYDKQLKTKADARAIQKKILPKLEQYLKNKKAIIMIMGNIYVEALKPALEDLKMVPVYRMASKNGIFDYKKNIIKLLDGSLEVLYHFSGPEKKIHEIIAPGE